MSLMDLLMLVGGYLAGSIPFGLLVARWFGKIDIRKHGSGNIGATNVGRVMGIRWFFVVFLLDALKGLLPTLAATLLTKHPESTGLTPVIAPILTGLMAVIGHMAPCWLGFRGGKGVATALGVVVVIAPWGSLLAAVVFGLSFALWRTVSISSILGAFAFAVLQMILLKPHPFAADVWPIGLFSLFVPGLIIFRHRSNIARLLCGEEHAFRKAAPKEAPPKQPTP